jgi:rare lipoprotein A
MLTAPGCAAMVLGGLACLAHALQAKAADQLPQTLAWAGGLDRAPHQRSYSWTCPDALCNAPAQSAATDPPHDSPAPSAVAAPSAPAPKLLRMAAPGVTTVVAPLSGTTVVRASFYDTGRVTANGERFLPMGFTAASRKLPFGTKLRVTNTRTGRSVVVRVNDRGPFVQGRALDLSRGAAEAIGLDKSGVGPVAIAVVQ